jgi:predicted DNA binding CopG/RHH family protein
MPSQARKAANARYIAKLDQIKIQPVKAEGEAIRAAAFAAGMSLQAYILEAIREKMQRK